jgi:heat shock protein HslJ
LQSNQSYALRKTFEGRNERVEHESGSWDYSSDRIVMVLRSTRDAWSYFAMPAPGVLRAVDARGDSIGQRAPADLQRSDSVLSMAIPASLNGPAPSSVNAPLSGVEWKLVELEHKPVRPATKDRREILMSFDAPSQKISGQSGCNRLEGTFEAGWKALALKLSHSLPLCRIDDGTERAVGRLIKATRTYRIAGTTLDFFDERGTRVARLESRPVR